MERGKTLEIYTCFVERLQVRQPYIDVKYNILQGLYILRTTRLYTEISKDKLKPVTKKLIF